MNVGIHPGKIHVLPGEIVSRIAAGEVIERPAAVVKELIDNSLDAHSSRIAVDIVDGGRRLIKVTDDGDGISAADVPLAFQRHATSKLRDDADLYSIETLGFRGEALPSIASVSKVRLLTAARHEPVGTLLVMEGAATKLEEASTPYGTRIEIAELFFNTPARKKFLKTTGTEFSHICQAVQQAALAWPDVHFHLTHNGQDVCNYPAAATTKDRILQVYGESIARQMASVQGELSGLRVHGMAITATSARTGRSPQEIFVNRRPVKNATIAHAIYDGYGVSLSKGSHPLFVLFLEVDPSRVDVNVHPTKREVRFADQDHVHRAVHRAIRSAVGSATEGVFAGSPIPLGTPFDVKSRPLEGFPRAGFEPSAASSRSTASPWNSVDAQAPSLTSTVRESTSSYLVQPLTEVVPFGQVHCTFLVAQVGSELQVIDQHTAHERVLFERLVRSVSQQAVVQQPLLIPETISMPLPQAVRLESHVADLAKLGLELEPFGAGTFLLRTVPALLGHVDGAAMVRGFLEDMSDWSSAASFEQRMRPILATMACHTAVRAGRPLALSEIKALVEDWVAEGLPATCPHGRRVALRLQAEELAKIFGR